MKRRENGFEHSIEVCKDLGVPKPHDVVTKGDQVLVSNLIVNAVDVLAPVEFYDKLVLSAGEVSNVWLDGLLSNELVTSQLAVLDPGPELHFGIGLRTPKLPRTCGLFTVCAPHRRPLTLTLSLQTGRGDHQNFSRSRPFTCPSAAASGAPSGV
jgi:hypothetical protein